MKLMVARAESKPPTRGFSAGEGGSRGLLINHLQRLPAPSPGPPRHNHGTPNLSSAHSWHTGIYGFIATEVRPSMLCPEAFAPALGRAR